MSAWFRCYGFVLVDNIEKAFLKKNINTICDFSCLSIHLMRQAIFDHYLTNYSDNSPGILREVTANI